MFNPNNDCNYGTSNNTINRNKTAFSSANYESHDKDQSVLKMTKSGLTLGKMMSLIAMVDDVLAAMGPDGVDMLIEQYRRMGLKSDDEQFIYNVVLLLNESKILTDDLIAMLYRFGQTLGINDKDAELQYTRLMANKNHKTPDRNISREIR